MKSWTSVAQKTKWWTPVSVIDSARATRSQTDLSNETNVQGEKSANANLLRRADLADLLRDSLLPFSP